MYIGPSSFEDQCNDAIDIQRFGVIIIFLNVASVSACVWYVRHPAAESIPC